MPTDLCSWNSAKPRSSLRHGEAERELERQRERDQPVEQDRAGAVARLGGYSN